MGKRCIWKLTTKVAFLIMSLLQVTTSRVFLSSSLLGFILLIVQSFQLFCWINFKKVSILKAYRANLFCFQIQVIVFQDDIGSLKHMLFS